MNVIKGSKIRITLVKGIGRPYSSLPGDFLGYIPQKPTRLSVKVVQRACASAMIFLLLLAPMHRLLASEDLAGETTVIVESSQEIQPVASDEPEIVTAEPHVMEEVADEPETNQEETEPVLAEEESPAEIITPTPSDEVSPSPIASESVEVVLDDVEVIPASTSNESDLASQQQEENTNSTESTGGEIVAEESVPEEEVIQEEENLDIVPEAGENIDITKIRQEILDEIFKELSVSSLQELKNKMEAAEKRIQMEAAYPDRIGVSSVSSDIYSAKDESGDTEIYLNSEGVVTPITDNDREDDLVSWDLNKKFLTWQSLIDGRWQIFSYDIDKKTEQQVTNVNFNNTNPSTLADTIVWQGWVGDNWEIFIGQRNEDSLSEQPWRVKQLTDNYYHDMFPKISGNLITWQAFYKDNWHIFIYDLLTEQVRQVSGGEGLNENPRFMIAWDSKDLEGDIKTVAYDIVSGQVISLNSGDDEEQKSSDQEPVPLPDSNELPLVNIQAGASISSRSDSGDGSGDSDTQE